MTRSDPSALVRASLRANAAFSALSGFAFVFAGDAVAATLGVDAVALVRAIGVNLLGFAAGLAWVASRPRITSGLFRVIGAIIGCDVGWVLGTAGLVYAEAFSASGTAAAIAVASVVGAFALLQAIGLRRLGRARSTA